jgi:hypothetical protein
MWPEAFQQIRDLPAGTQRVYVKFRSDGPAIDSIRLAVYAQAAPPSGRLTITQQWREQGIRHSHVEQIAAAAKEARFSVRAGSNVQNEAIILAAH